MNTVCLHLPFYIAFVLMLAPFRQENKGRSWRRSVYDSALRYIASRRWNLRQNLLIFGTSSTEAYGTWTRKQKMESITDEIDEDAKLHWVGPKRYDRVLLWLHGKYSEFSSRIISLGFRINEGTLGRWRLLFAH